MIALTVYVAFVSSPPVGEALRQTVFPDQVDFATITTIVGGTVGGYITYAGAHRLLDKGMTGPENLDAVSRAALTGIAVTGVIQLLAAQAPHALGVAPHLDLQPLEVHLIKRQTGERAQRQTHDQAGHAQAGGVLRVGTVQDLQVLDFKGGYPPL